MRELGLGDGLVRFDGTVDVRLSSEGITPLRLPATVLAKLPPGSSAVASCAAGIRLALTTNASELAVEIEQVNLAPTDGTPVSPVYDLAVDGGLRESVIEPSGAIYDRLTDSIVQPGSPAVLHFANLTKGTKRLELWLPTMSWVTVRRVLVNDGAVVEPARDRRPRWIVHGSSITQGAKAFGPSQTWPACHARQADVDLLNLGMASNCLVEQWVARSIRDTRADQITLKLAVNVWNLAAMSAPSFVAAVHGFLDTIRDGHPTTPITVVSPLLTPGGETLPGPSVLSPSGRHVGAGMVGATCALTVEEMRGGLVDAVALRRSQGDQHLDYVDGRDLLGPGDVMRLGDGLHPDGAGHLLVGDRYSQRAGFDLSSREKIGLTLLPQ